jgi:Na+/H+-dicarboxylate symporter/ABC-type amino acid transport substrate-binding protein
MVLATQSMDIIPREKNKPESTRMIDYIKNTSLTFRIITGLVLGAMVGLFFGEDAAGLKLIGDIWIGLMQMTILPYVIVSLIVGLGQLDSALARQLAVRGGLLMLLFWGIALLVVAVMPMSFPVFENAAFFSAHAKEAVSQFNPIDLYIPSNPFHSMANTVIPAVVIFSSAVGVALIGMPKKSALIESLATFLEALGRVTKFIVGLTPIGVFAIVAVAAGTMTWAEIERLQVYFVVYIAASLYLALWVLPVLISTLTPFKYRDVFRYSKEALLTAFFTQNVFIILPMLIEGSKKLFHDYGLASSDTDSLSEVIVPVTFNFPNAGKLLSLMFVPFAAWLSGTPMEFSSYPNFLLSGLASYFAKAQIALPFLLDIQRLPQDLFQLYIPTGIINGKFDTMVSAMNLLAFSVIGTAALTGHLKISIRKIIRFCVLSAVLLILTVLGTRIFLGLVIDTSYHKDKVIMGMSLIAPAVQTTVYENIDDVPLRQESGLSKTHTILEQIQDRGVLRAGYVPGRLPFTFFNEHGELVGFDVELLNKLASEMGVGLEFVPLTWETLFDQVNSNSVDIVGTVPLTTEILMNMDISDPYLDGALSVVVRDHRRNEFSQRDKLELNRELTVAYPGPVGYIRAAVVASFPMINITWKEIHDFKEFFEQEEGTFDALIVEVEIGAAWTLLHPEYTVVIPESTKLNMPLGFAVPLGQHNFAASLGRWLSAKKATGDIEIAYDYWILGKGAEKKEPRWSIKKDVLHWEDN